MPHPDHSWWQKKNERREYILNNAHHLHQYSLVPSSSSARKSLDMRLSIRVCIIYKLPQELRSWLWHAITLRLRSLKVSLLSPPLICLVDELTCTRGSWSWRSWARRSVQRWWVHLAPQSPSSECCTDAAESNSQPSFSAGLASSNYLQTKHFKGNPLCFCFLLAFWVQPATCYDHSNDLSLSCLFLFVLVYLHSFVPSDKNEVGRAGETSG